MKKAFAGAALLVAVGAGVITSRYTGSQSPVFSPALAESKTFHVVWCPGGYTNFVIVGSENLAVPLVEWKSFWETTDTNFYFEIYGLQNFFAVYGTNSDGDFSWGAGGTNCHCK